MRRLTVPHSVLRCVVVACVAAATMAMLPLSAPAQSARLPTSLPDAQLVQLLNRRGHLTLREATLVEALFALREQWNVDMVVSNNVEGQVSATFTNATLREILDSLLLSRGYGYQVVGKSLVVLPLEQLGALKPLFNTEIIQLQHARPADLLAVVELLLSPQGKAIPVDASRSLMILDYPDRVAMIRDRLQLLDRPAALPPGVRQPAPGPITEIPTAVPDADEVSDGTVELEVRVFRPQYVKAQTLLPAVQTLITEEGRVAVLDDEDQILVAERPELLNVIEEALRELDQPRPQVRIWAMIYDCSLEDVERLGVNWNARFFGRAVRADGMTPADQIMLDSITSAVPAAGAVNSALTLATLGSNTEVTAMINALNEARDTKLLADPNVVVRNHDSAMIEIVTEVPYQQLTEGLEGGSIGTTAFREAGVTLSVTPHIARDGTISLVVNPKFSALVGFTEQDEQPIIDRREAKTTVRVANSQTFVLGGLRQKTRINERTGVPWLKDRKYVGKFFRFRQDTYRESELLVFLTPELVSTSGNHRPRERVAEEEGFDELDWNRRATGIEIPAHFYDDQSRGGPPRPVSTHDEFSSQRRFVPPAPVASDGQRWPEPVPPASAPQPTDVFDETAGRVTIPGITGSGRPGSQTLKNRLRVQPGSRDQNRSGGDGDAGDIGSDLPLPDLDVGNLLNILQMSGEEDDRRKRKPSRIRLLPFVRRK